MGVRHTETNLIVWSRAGETAGVSVAVADPQAQPVGTAHRFYDAGDRGCAGGPMDEIAALLRKMAGGETLEIHATDPSVAVDLAAWCRMTGNQLVEQRGDRFWVKKP